MTMEFRDALNRILLNIDSNSIFLEDEIKPVSHLINEREHVAVVKFKRSDVHDILNVGEVELTITGRLTDGTPFEATDTIRVLNRTGQKKK